MNYDKERIKELILTDYLDGQLDDRQKKAVDEAIARDPELAGFLRSVQQKTQKPFLRAEDVQPPAHLWENIKRRIKERNTPGRAFTGRTAPRNRLRSLWERPRLSFAAATVMAVVIIFVWMGIGRFHVTAPASNGQEQMEYLIYLAGNGITEQDDVDDGFGTSIESYFL